MHLINDHNNFNNTLTFIVPSQGKDLSPLTRHRPQALMPFGREQRIIDFALSNCWNSGIRKAFVLPDRHLQLVSQYLDSFDWNGNLITVSPDPSRRYTGSADALFQNVGVLQLYAPEYVLVLLTDHIYEMDYGRLVRFHMEHGGQVTIATNGVHDIGVFLFKATAFRKLLLVDALAKGNQNLDQSVVFRAAAR